MVQNTADYPMIRTVGLHGLVVTFAPNLTDAANTAALSFRAAVDRLNWPEVLESSCTLVSAFFRVDLVEQAPEPIIERLQDVLNERDWLTAGLPDGRTLWTIPAAFVGHHAPQLEEAAALAGLSIGEARRDLTSTDLRVLTLGFAPGQPYLGHMPDAWNFPRQSVLSERVPKGALVAAVQQLCLFTKETPTGWRHVGQTAFECFQPNAHDPFPLKPGDVLRFQEVSEAEFARIEASGDPLGGAHREDIA